MLKQVEGEFAQKSEANHQQPGNGCISQDDDAVQPTSSVAQLGLKTFEEIGLAVHRGLR